MNLNTPAEKQTSNPYSDFIYLATPSIWNWVVCLLACIAWIIASKPSLLSHITEYYYGGIEGDAGIYVWLVKHVQLKFTSYPWFDTDAFYPYSRSLAFSDNFILPGILYSLIYAAVNQEILSYNCTLIAIQLFGALAFFRFIFALTEDLSTSTFSAILLLTLSPFAGHLGHPQLQCYFCFPVLLFLCFKFLQKPSGFTGFFIGTCITLSFLCSVYYAVFCALLFFSFFAGFFLLFPTTLKKRELVTLVASSICGILPALPFLKPYLAIKDLFGKRELYEAFAFSATPLSYLSFTPFNWIFYGLNSLSHPEAQLAIGPTIFVIFLFSIMRIFEGDRLYPCKIGILGLFFLLTAIYTIIPLLILSKLFTTCISWLLLCWTAYSLYMLGKVEREHQSTIVTNRDVQALLLWCAVCFLVISFGPISDPVKNEFSFSPYTFLYNFFPGLSGIRAVGRAGLMFCFLITALFSLSANFLRAKKLISPLLFTFLFAIPVSENFCNLFPYDKPLSQPPVFETLKELLHKSPDKKTAAIMLPYAKSLNKNSEVLSWSDFARVNVYAMNWFSDLPVSFINGYSGQKTKIMRELPRRLAEFPDAGSIRELSSYPELEYIIVVPKLYSSFDKLSFEAKLDLYKNDLQILQRDPEGNYLLRFVGSIKVDPAFIVKTKGSYDGTTLSFAAAQPCSEMSVHLKVFEDESLTPFTTLAVPGDHSVHKMRIDLSSLKSTIGIRRFRFQAVENCTVMLSHG